jgi:7-cyano-7-deazaguanine synthase
MTQKQNNKAVALVSGGQDSLTVLECALADQAEVTAVCFDYGQRHIVELDCALSYCRDRGVNLIRLPMPFLGTHVTSMLTEQEGELDDFDAKHPRLENLPVSFVPARNALMLTMAHALACEIGASYVYAGMCETDYSGYPDCREAFITSLQNTLNLGYEAQVAFVTPLMHIDKAATFALAEKLGRLDDILEQSHTCYNGVRSVRHAWGYGCGRCPACDLRRRGFDQFKLEQETA